MRTKFLIVISAFMLLIGFGFMATDDALAGVIISVVSIISIVCAITINKERKEAKLESHAARQAIIELKRVMDSGVQNVDIKDIDEAILDIEKELMAEKQAVLSDNKKLGKKRELQAENEKMKAEIERLNSLVDPNAAKADDAKKLLAEIENKITEKQNDLHSITQELESKRKEVSIYDDDIQMIEFGLYKPVYEFANSEMYKNRLEALRLTQKEMIKNNTAATFPENMTLDGSAKLGNAMIKDNVKQILRSFNNECEVLINKVKFNNVDAYRQRIIKSYDQLNKLNARLNIQITKSYLETKLDELTLSYEYAVKKQEEKERAKEERERLREEAKLQKEIESQRKALEKEQQQYQKALETIETQLKTNPEDPDLLAKKAELEANLDEVHKGIEDVDYREANKRAGYVYIISNIGSFGENVYKIGMTRRLEPMDRVNELGDASVPFNFDVHAMIFSDDAPALENALHHAFEDKRVNMINNRREFFRVSLDEIEKVVKESFKERVVEFTRVPEAEQYRESEKMRQNA